MMINEIFYSLQGEGIQIGVPTTFIRTTGCNLRCSWCDTKYAYEEGSEKSIKEIMGEVKGFPTNHICITGGEPMLQKDAIKLIEKLGDEGYEVCLETNGSQSVQEIPSLDFLMISLDIKCPSSGMHTEMELSNFKLLRPNDQLKFIIDDLNDYEYAKDIIAGYNPICTIIMMPVGGKELRNLAEWVLSDRLKVRVLPQLHKLIWGEKRGV
ncbi:MAG: radical SAM protein [Thermoplasmata archaeon]